MDVIEAIESRRSIRAFKTDPVPKEVLEKIMLAGLRAPSYENTQPWEFAVLGPGVFEKLKKEVADKVCAGDKIITDIPFPKYSGEYRERERALAKQMRETFRLSSDDPVAFTDWWLGMVRFFDAPNAIIAYMDRSLSEWSILDTGLALQNILLAAWHYGVGTCIMAGSIIYPDFLRSLLNIPESKRFIVGMAVGYPDLSSPKATFRTGRDPMDALVTWHGCD